MTPTTRSIVFWAARVALFALLAIAMTWPLARQLDRAVSDPGDPFILMWTLHHDYLSTFSDPANLFQAPIFHPLRYTLAFSEHVYGIAIFAFPFFAAGLKPIVVYNLMLLLGIVGSGVGAFVLCRYVTRSEPAALVGAIFFMFVPFRFLHLPHLQHQWAMWLPLLFAATLFYFDRPGWRRAALVGGAFFMNGLTNVHWFLFGSTGFALIVLLRVGVSHSNDRMRTLVRLVVVTLLASAFLLPFLLPYRTVETMYGMKRPLGEIDYYSAHASDWLRPPRMNRLYGSSDLAARGEPEAALFPGLFVLLLCGAALLLQRRTTPAVANEEADPDRRLLRVLDIVTVVALVAAYAGALNQGPTMLPFGARMSGATLPLTIACIAAVARLWLRYPSSLGEGSLRQSILASRFPFGLWVAFLLVVIGALGALGTNAFFHDFLVRYLEPFRAIRVPARWAMITYCGLAVIASAGAALLIDRVRGRWKSAAAAALSVPILLEGAAAPIRWYLVDPVPSAVYQWLGKTEFPGAVLELPLDLRNSEYAAMYGQMFHRKPIVNGVSGFEPETHVRIRELLAGGHVDLLTAQLEKLGVSVVVVHADAIVEQHRDVRDWVRSATASGRLKMVGHFDQSVLGAWVFALRRNFDPPSPPDVAMLNRLFDAGEPLPNGSTFGYVDYPRFGDELQGEFTIFGWTLSPHDVRQVNVLFDNGRYTVPAERGPYAPVHKRHPWYPDNEKPAFWLRLPQPPGGREGDHDLQVEVIDGSGKASRLEHVWFRWEADEVYAPREWHKQRLKLLARGLGEPDSVADALRSGTMRLDALGGWWVEKNRHLADPEFLERSYQAFLRRKPREDERLRDLARLRGALTRDGMVRVLTNADEFAGLYLKASAQRSRGLID